MTEHPNGWNHRIIQALPCGCVVGVTTYEGVRDDGRLEWFKRSLEAGYTLSLVAWDDEAAQARHCDRYPHEQWQIDYQRRLKAFADYK